jgi:hypothetical protein
VALAELVVLGDDAATRKAVNDATEEIGAALADR